MCADDPVFILLRITTNYLLLFLPKWRYENRHANNKKIFIFKQLLWKLFHECKCNTVKSLDVKGLSCLACLCSMAWWDRSRDRSRDRDKDRDRLQGQGQAPGTGSRDRDRSRDRDNASGEVMWGGGTSF